MSDCIKLVMLVMEVAMATTRVEEIMLVVAMAESLGSGHLATCGDVENAPHSNSKNHTLPSEQLPGCSEVPKVCYGDTCSVSSLRRQEGRCICDFSGSLSAQDSVAGQRAGSDSDWSQAEKPLSSPHSFQSRPPPGVA